MVAILILFDEVNRNDLGRLRCVHPKRYQDGRRSDSNISIGKTSIKGIPHRSQCCVGVLFQILCGDTGEIVYVAIAPDTGAISEGPRAKETDYLKVLL